MKNKKDSDMVEAICLLTYPDEDDMIDFAEGGIEPCDVRINYAGEVYLVNKNNYDKKYFKLKDNG